MIFRMDGPGRAPPGASAEWREMIDRLYALATGGMNLGLDRIDRMLAALGRPEHKFPAIHVAGTNGKGSACAFVASILSERRTIGLYTSPHLERLEERVQLVRRSIARAIPPETLLESFRRVDAIGFGELSFFEVITAAGLHAFAEAKIDAAVIEAGIGARLDATRLVQAEVSVLTDLSLEHTAILGDTLEAIAAEKSAVIRPGKPIIFAGAPEGADRVIVEAAKEARAPLFTIGREIDVVAHRDGSFDLKLSDRVLEAVQLSLLGPHQGRNALLAVQAALQFDPTLSDEIIRRALAATTWPGRMEIIRRKGRPPLLLDGAHNPQGAGALAAGIAGHPEIFSTPIHLVFGVLGDKEPAPMIEALAPLVSTVIAARADSPRARDPSSLLPLLPAGLRKTAAIAEDVSTALAIAEARARADQGWVAVAGSLYLVGEARALTTAG